MIFPKIETVLALAESTQRLVVLWNRMTENWFSFSILSFEQASEFSCSDIGKIKSQSYFSSELDFIFHVICEIYFKTEKVVPKKELRNR